MKYKRLFYIIIIFVIICSIHEEKHSFTVEVKNHYLDESVSHQFNYEEGIKYDTTDYILYNIPDNLKVSELINKITTNGVLSVVNSDGQDVGTNELVVTGYYLKMSFSDGYSGYVRLSIKGDVLAEGKKTAQGIKTVARHIIDGNVITDKPFIYSADYTVDGEIRVNDVAKLARDIDAGYETTVYKASFVIQDANAATTSSTLVSCYPSRGASTCTITVPTLTARSGYTAIGWNTKKKTTVASVEPGSTITLSRSMTYYAITRSSTKYTATFSITNSSWASADGTSASCYLHNGESDCEITAPTITPASGYGTLGWNTNRNAHVASIKNGGKGRINGNVTYYGIVAKAITITFDKNTTFDDNTVSVGASGYDYRKSNIQADSLEYYSRTCLNFDNTGCYLDDAPAIYSSGHEIQGFSTTKRGTGNGTLSEPILKQKFTRNTTLYARVYDYYFGTHYTKGESFMIGNKVVEFERGVDSITFAAYKEFLERLYDLVPVLFNTNGKIFILSDATYVAIGEAIDRTTSSGFTSVNHIHSNVVLRLMNNSPYEFYTPVHELGHSFDSSYAAYTRDSSSTLSSKNDLKELYNANKNIANRPMEDYAYQSTVEFFAEAVASYIGKQYLPYEYNRFKNYVNSYSNLYNDSTADIDAYLDKLFCVAENNYNLEANCP